MGTRRNPEKGHINHDGGEGPTRAQEKDIFETLTLRFRFVSYVT